MRDRIDEVVCVGHIQGNPPATIKYGNGEINAERVTSRRSSQSRRRVQTDHTIADRMTQYQTGM